jgi:hypothetical protein
MRQLKCFIASSFGHKDVDYIFDRCIKPVLKELTISAYRVDRVNHNEKIDNKIIELINQCDFGIVDLSFARPSVYYEAGLLEGQEKKVIYICREDHFKANSSDIHDITKIHFDLITKNIIAWSKPSSTFSNKLRLRIKLVIKPIVSQLLISHVNLSKEKEFENKSLSDRAKEINDRLISYALSKKFAYKTVSGMGFKRLVKGDTELVINVFNSITKTELADLGYRQFNTSRGNSKKIMLVCLLKSLTKNRIENALKHFKNTEKNTFVFMNTKVILLYPIKSINNLELRLKEISLK